MKHYFHDKKKENSLQMARKKSIKQRAKRNTKKIVLIICEGEVVERSYFRNLKNQFRLLPINIEIKTKLEIGGNAPKNIVQYAKEAYEDFKYDQIFCVFDKDSHPSYREAIKEIQKLREKKQWPILAIHSAPCFEYWFLLHFKYTSSPYQKVGKKTTGDLCVSQLKKHIKDYDKTKNTITKIFPQLFAKIDDAIKNAKKIQTASKKDDFDEPFTNVNLIIEYLQNGCLDKG